MYNTQEGNPGIFGNITLANSATEINQTKVIPEMIFIGSGDDTSTTDDERYFVRQHSSGILMYILDRKGQWNKSISSLTLQLEFIREINTLHCYPLFPAIFPCTLHPCLYFTDKG